MYCVTSAPPIGITIHCNTSQCNTIHYNTHTHVTQKNPKIIMDIWKDLWHIKWSLK